MRQERRKLVYKLTLLEQLEMIALLREFYKTHNFVSFEIYSSQRQLRDTK